MTEPARPPNSFRITVTLPTRRDRIDQVLMEELRKQDRNLILKKISRVEFKQLFKQKKVFIKGQSALPSSSLAMGTTHIDIVGFKDSI